MLDVMPLALKLPEEGVNRLRYDELNRRVWPLLCQACIHTNDVGCILYVASVPRTVTSKWTTATG